MKKYLKQLVSNIVDDEQVAYDLGDEEAFREIVDWDYNIKEPLFVTSLQALCSKDLDSDEVRYAETVNQLEELVNEYR